MNLTPELKQYIDQLTYYELLAHWRFAPIGDKWMQGETGTYWKERMGKLQAANPEQAVRDSKELGWR